MIIGFAADYDLRPAEVLVIIFCCSASYLDRFSLGSILGGRQYHRER
jgi:hypothetical protein